MFRIMLDVFLRSVSEQESPNHAVCWLTDRCCARCICMSLTPALRLDLNSSAQATGDHGSKATIYAIFQCSTQISTAQDVLNPQFSIDQDVTLAAGKDKGTKLPGLPLMIPDATAGIDAYEFSVSSGAMIDWSLRGEDLGLTVTPQFQARARRTFSSKGAIMS